MSVLNYYFNYIPEDYLITSDNQINQIKDYLTVFFGKDWGEFSFDYVDKTKQDRIIKKDENGNVIFHARIFNKDFDGLKCYGVGGTFKSPSAPTSAVIEVFDLFFNSVKNDVMFEFGMCPEWLAQRYISEIMKGGDYTDYNKELVLYYFPFNGFKMSDEILNKIKNMEMF